MGLGPVWATQAEARWAPEEVGLRSAAWGSVCPQEGPRSLCQGCPAGRSRRRACSRCLATPAPSQGRPRARPLGTGVRAGGLWCLPSLSKSLPKAKEALRSFLHGHKPRGFCEYHFGPEIFPGCSPCLKIAPWVLSILGEPSPAPGAKYSSLAELLGTRVSRPH